jgi:hypothetical protein
MQSTLYLPPSRILQDDLSKVYPTQIQALPALPLLQTFSFFPVYHQRLKYLYFLTSESIGFNISVPNSPTQLDLTKLTNSGSSSQIELNLKG